MKKIYLIFIIINIIMLTISIYTKNGKTQVTNISICSYCNGTGEIFSKLETKKKNNCDIKCVKCIKCYGNGKNFNNFYPIYS
jgi:uncharacterized protein with PIN domain